ncbi:response regulator [Oceanobacillus bengalensis]|uniref:Response regulator n=1 Tax=Oceanobacillus bengalensis TaxID=1435466 RepID=A0A494Z417_9BACI|nr:response regulator [Oceanobacillus bengalensis]RKQ17276.1 response regulator [Oceanobacillus bengalensis]
MARVVIVDDAKFMRVTLANMLTKAGHEIIGEADNGREAVKQYQSLSPDIVTMDITMPVMNGIEATKAITQSDKDAKIIVCSAMGQQKVVMEAIEAGAKDFIVKPFDETRVLDTISRILG